MQRIPFLKHNSFIKPYAAGYSCTSQKMKKLNSDSTKIFCALIDNLEEGYQKIVNEPFMPLVIEHIGEALLSPYGMAVLYSLCHYQKENGDLMQDTEMCFAMVDNRQRLEDYALVDVLPYMYQQASLGLYETSLELENNRFTQMNVRRQIEHTDFADSWLHNIKQQGFLQRIKK